MNRCKSVGLFVLWLVSSPMFGAEVKITKEKDVITFTIEDEVVTRYHVANTAAKPYFWPLQAKGNIGLTRDWPMKKGEKGETTDHVHQKSAWFCHGDVIPEGLELKVKSADKRVEGVDFWSEAPGHGKMVCVEVGEPQNGMIRTKNEWRTADGIKILDETRTITLKDLHEARLLILDIDLHASVCPITFGDTKEGSMGVRMADVLSVKLGTGTIVSAEGKQLTKKKDEGVWGHQSLWNDYVGQINGKTVGLAIFNDPTNPSASWHSRDYGLMAANPFGRNGSGFPSQKGKKDLIKLAKDEHLKLRYGILLHLGDTQSAKVAELYKQFVK